MKINRKNALQLWEEYYGELSLWEKDFHGNWMYKDAYGDTEALAYTNGNSHPLGRDIYSSWYSFGSPISKKINCGWNIHHILPKANGGTNEKSNLMCTNIITNREAEDKITFWIDDCNYQVQRIKGTREHEIVRLNPSINQIFGYHSFAVKIIL